MNKRMWSIVLAGGLVISGVLAGPATAGKKKKKPKPPPAPAACQAYAPGELGAEKPTVVVTDAATEAAPIEQKVTLDLSVANYDLAGAETGPLAISSDFFNIQVDTAKADAGLYVYLEFPERRDYDIDLMYADTSYAARSHDGNTTLGVGTFGQNGGHAGEATTKSEKIVGVRTPDCAGYTLETANWFGEGGELTVKMWLGEAVNDPLAPGEEPRG